MSSHETIDEFTEDTPELIRPARIVGASLGAKKGGPMPPVRFRFRHRAASTVTVAGDFNGWNSASHPLERQAGDVWILEVELSPGRHEYKFFVDGQQWWNDPEAPKVRNSWRSENSYIEVARGKAD